VLEAADLGPASALAGVDGGEAADAADALAAVGILGPGRPLAFIHPMVREGLYGELSPAERERGHRAGARLLHDSGAPPERVAEHLLATDPAGEQWTVDRLAEAGARAAASGAPESAAVDLALARGFGTPSAHGLALRAAGLATGGRRGEELLRNAVDVLAGSEARVEEIRAQTDLGAHLRRANRRAEAREHLRAALDAAHRTGAGALATRAETELRATGARPRSRVLSGLDSLTASERRVADLASEGMTNREIAQALFVTARTVEGHLTQAFRKLDVSSRDELASALGAPGA
jgi:DNA-binding CsgD family transcriptional regulator